MLLNVTSAGSLAAGEWLFAYLFDADLFVRFEFRRLAAGYRLSDCRITPPREQQPRVEALFPTSRTGKTKSQLSSRLVSVRGDAHPYSVLVAFGTGAGIPTSVWKMYFVTDEYQIFFLMHSDVLGPADASKLTTKHQRWLEHWKWTAHDPYSCA